MIKVTNNDICNILYSIRDSINDGNFESAIEIAKELEATLILANKNTKCNISCKDCKDNK